MAGKAHLYEPVGRIRKSQGTRDRETVAALVRGSIYRLGVLGRLRRGAWGAMAAAPWASGAAEAGDGEEGAGAVMGVLTALVRGANDDVFHEALHYLDKGEEE